MNAFDELAGNFSRLPGIGKKSAIRMVNWLLKQDASYVQHFAQNLASLQEKIQPCSICGNWTETDPCPICSDPMRDKSQICVVEQPQDVTTFESYGEFKGLYHVLGGLIKPLEGLGPAQLSIQPLLNRIRNGNVAEVILATNPTIEGEATAMYISRLVKPSGIRTTRIAHGLPVGGDLEYADEVTLSKAIEGRREL